MAFIDPRAAAEAAAIEAFIDLIHGTAKLIDNHLGEDALNVIVNATVIERSGTALAAALRGNPRTVWLAAFIPVAKEMARIAYSTQYRGMSVYDALVSRGLAHVSHVKYDGKLAPEIKALIKGYHVQIVRDALAQD